GRQGLLQGGGDVGAGGRRRSADVLDRARSCDESARSAARLRRRDRQGPGAAGGRHGPRAHPRRAAVTVGAALPNGSACRTRRWGGNGGVRVTVWAGGSP